MKYYKHITSTVICCIAFSCVSQKMQNDSQIIGYEKYNSRTFTFIDNLLRENIPNILMEHYYNNLSDSDFHSARIEISKNDSIRYVILESKQAKSGYMYINEFSNNFISINKPVFYTINSDTINEKNLIIKLINLERSQIKSIDTLKLNKSNEIRILIK
jgi:hypothetical protein